MITPGSSNPLLFSADDQYQIARSLRFNSADSAYLNRTPASAGNRKTWTWSGWNKPSKLDNNGYFFSADDGSGGAETYIEMSSGNQLNVGKWTGSAYDMQVRTSQVFRDPSAYYHIVVAVDTTQATDSNRVKIYVNGNLVTALANNTYPTQNSDLGINNTTAHAIGRSQENAGRYYDGYLTEVNFIDGQALTPSSFGESDAATGVWKPKKYTGTYGTNGFYLNFSDNSNTTSGTLGKDTSGNGNDWTPNNFSVTAGAGNDSLVDTPTAYGSDTGVGGEVRGNYATLNPLATGVTLSNGNLDLTNGASNKSSYSTIGVSSGKWYFEAVYSATGSTTSPGVALQGYADPTTFVGGSLYSYGYDKTANKYNNNSGSAYGATYTTNDVIGVALDLDAGTLVFYKNGVSQGTAYSSLPAGTYFLGASSYNATGSVNFGQRPFAYTAPSGFKALCTTNLPTPTIGATSTTQANKYFDATIYTGNGTSQSITNSGSMQPDLVWVKDRSNARYNTLSDAVRGAGKVLFSNTTQAESGNSGDLIQSFNSNGFTVNNTYAGGTNPTTNGSTETYVGWQWKANGSGSSNTSGSITSTVSANTTAGFSIATFTSPASGSFTVGHGLGVAPSMIIVKNSAATSSWTVWHIGLTGGASNNTYNLYLDQTAAQGSTTNFWGTAAPTSTVFGQTVGTSVYASNAHVAYCFAAVAGYSAFGSYTGNGSADGPFVYTGFRPRYVLMKSSSGAGSNWRVFDTSRDPYNVINYKLSPNDSSGDYTDANTKIDFVSNGFKLRETAGDMNSNGGTYIYAAFAESPFKYSLAR